MSAPRLAALALAACASAAFAQSSDSGDSPENAALRDIAAVKAGGGIAPEIFAKLEAFRPATTPRLQGTLHRVVLKRAITRDGKAVGSNHRTIEFLPGAPGYQFESDAVEGNTTALLSYGPFLTVQLRATRHVAQTFPHLDKDTTYATKVTDVSLPASFDDALTPGKVWQTITESDTAIAAKNAITSINRSSFGILKRTCATSERKPAHIVSPALQGTTVFIACQQPDKPDEGVSFAYLEDYGVFIPVDLATKVAPQGTRLINVFTVEQVDVDAPPAGALLAQAPAPAGAALPSLAEARAAYQRHDDATAFKDLTALAEAGEVHAQILLSLMYADGRGTPLDLAASAQWTLKAAEQGMAVAQAALGVDYRDGRGVPVDPQAAFGWFMKAAQQGHADAQGEVGVAYSQGIGAPKDMAAALEWTRKAAEQGNVGAQANLGILYSGQVGIPADFAKAALWTRRAADRGNVNAQAQLCFLYARGNGVPRDNEQAYFWCVLAGNAGSALARTNSGPLESTLPPALRARVIAKTLEWKPVAASAPPAP